MNVLVLGHSGNYFEKQVEEACAQNKLRYVCIEGESHLYRYLSENEVSDGSIMFVVLSNGDDMPRKSAFIKRIRTVRKDIHIIICINSMDIIDTAFELNPDGMIQYYISQKSLAQYINKFIQKRQLKESVDDTIALKKKSAIFRIDANEIAHAESDGRKVTVFFKNSTAMTFYLKLNELQDMLPNRFVRIHQSYLVNQDQIEKVENGTVILKDGDAIKISKKYIDWVRQMIS